jgi:hypothetical protein
MTSRIEQVLQAPRTYAPPRLERYGSVSELTAAGTSGPTEANSSGQCRGVGTSDPSRQQC